MKFSIIIALLCIVCVYSHVEFEQGTDQTIGWASVCKHTLQCDSNIGRYIDTTVKFNNKFSTTPQVGLAIKTLDHQAGFPSSFDVTLLTISSEGFTYRVTAYTSLQVYSVHINWFAVLDSNIRIQYVNQLSTPQFQQGQSTNQRQAGQYLTESFIINYDRPLECENPTADVFLLGGEVVGGANELVVYTIDFSDPAYVEIAAEVTSGFVNWVSFLVVAGCQERQESIWIGQQVADQGTNWTEGSGKRSQTFYKELDNPQFFYDGFMFLGISALDLPGQHNTRINIESANMNGDTLSVTMGTWAGTVLDALFVSAFSYLPQNQCAILYSECDFQGDMLQVCSGEPINSMAVKQWGSRNVKSVQVPYGRKLTLFDAENLEGPYTQVQGDVSCASGWTFS